MAIHYNSASTKSDAEATVAAIQDAGARGFAFQADLTTAGRGKAIRRLGRVVGSVDIAINTVGKVLKKPIPDITEAEYDEMAR